MLVYNYDPQTGEFIDIQEAVPNPMEEGKFLVPAHATSVPPLEAKEGFVPSFNGVDWQYIEDNRDKEYWLIGDTWMSEPRKMTHAGPLPKTALLTKPEKTREELEDTFRNIRNSKLDDTDKMLLPDFPILDVDKQKVLAYRKELRDMTLLKGFPWDGGNKNTPWPELTLGVK